MQYSVVHLSSRIGLRNLTMISSSKGSCVGRAKTLQFSGDGSSLITGVSYAVQLVKQVNHRPQESIRYFVPTKSGSDILEATEDALVQENFAKLNTYFIGLLFYKCTLIYHK